jgi:hypothetical protein
VSSLACSSSSFWSSASSASSSGFASRLSLRDLDHLVDRSLHVEGLLGQVVVLSVEDLAETANRLGDRDVDAVAARERLRDEERL